MSPFVGCSKEIASHFNYVRKGTIRYDKQILYKYKAAHLHCNPDIFEIKIEKIKTECHVMLKSILYFFRSPNYNHLFSKKN